MVVLVTCKNENDPIKIKAQEWPNFLRRSREDNSVVSVAVVWSKLKLVQAVMNVLDTCKNEENPVKMKALKWLQHFFHYKYIGMFRDAEGQLTP